MNVSKVRMRCLAKILTILVISVLMLPQAYSQSEFRFRHLTTREGLPSEFINGIMEDSVGFIWINCASSIARFDGHKFKIYAHDPDDTLQSPGEGTVGPFMTDHSGNLWILPQGNNAPSLKMTLYDRKSDTFLRYKIPLTPKSIYWNSVDRAGTTLWFGTRSEGIASYDTKSRKTSYYSINHGDSTKRSLRNQIRGIWDWGNSLLLITQDGAILFDKSTQEFKRPPCDPADSDFFYHHVRMLMPDFKRNRIWLASDHEQYRDVMFLADGDQLSIRRKFFIPEQVRERAFVFDRDSIFWFTGSDGLTRYNPRTGEMKKIQVDKNDPNSLRSNRVNRPMLDRNQNLWVSSSKGISILRHGSIAFQNVSFPDGQVTGTFVYTTGAREYLIIGKKPLEDGKLSDRTDLLIAALDDQYPTHDNFKFLASITCNATTAFWKGKEMLWIGAQPVGAIGLPIDRTSGLPVGRDIKVLTHIPGNPNSLSARLMATDLWEDPNQNLWITTKNNGLVKIVWGVPYGSEGSIVQYTHNADDSLSIDHNVVYNIFPASENSAWVTTDVSLQKFDYTERKPQFFHVFRGREAPTDIIQTRSNSFFVGTYQGFYKQKPGAPNSFIRVPGLEKYEVATLLEDKMGRIWATNYGGTVCYDPQSGHAIPFSEEDGLKYTQAGGGQIVASQTSSGFIVLSEEEGISIFNPSELTIDRRDVSPALTSIKINNKIVRGVSPVDSSGFSIPGNISELNELTLDYWHNNFTLEFSAMDMAFPEKNSFQHKLDGYDKGWILSDHLDRTVTYTNLDAGTYTFRLKASNRQGIWSEKERALKVIVLPPPWRTWWAYTGYWALGAGLLVLARRSIVQRERLKSSLALEKVEREKEHFELEKAKEVDKVKTSFFTNISHEFRTPLTLIKGPVDTMLERYKDDPEAVNRLKLVQRNSDLLLKLINQLLDLAKLESGTLKVEKSEAEVNSFVRAIASSFESMARQKGVTLNLDVPSETCAARFDKDKAETILINLVNNAIKFTPSGGTVSVKAEAGSTQGPTPNTKHLNLIVSDTGIGIPPEHQSKIFERFHQVSESHKEIGTGIGLALVKELVTLMGGEINVRSEIGKGSTFTVSLPLEPVIGDRLSVIGGAVPGANGQPMEPELGFKKEPGPPITDHGSPITEARAQVLVVEDNADLRAFIIDSLGTEFHFHQAENGKQGLQIATEQIPDMIISDVMMPEMDGMEMTRRIKEDIKTSHIPLILLTAKSGEDSKLEGLQKGADDYLTKPFNKQELLLKVRNGTARMQKIREKLKTEVLTAMPAVEVQSADEQFLTKVKETIIERMSDEQLSVESLADDIGMSRVQLYRKVSALTGMSVNELIRKLRLQRAAQLLSQNWGPVSQVAYEVGFSNLSYFSKVFKEELGALPSEYVERT